MEIFKNFGELFLLVINLVNYAILKLFIFS